MLLMSACVAALLSGQVECLVARMPDGELLLVKIGSADHVDLPPRIDGQLLTPGEGVALVHSHPRGLGLSGDDLMQLIKPGVRSIEALGSDGSRYRAARGPRFDPATFSTVWRRAMQLVPRFLQMDGLPSDDQLAMKREGNHLICLALDDAGVIAYDARLSAFHSAAALRQAARVTRARAAIAGVIRHELPR